MAYFPGRSPFNRRALLFLLLASGLAVTALILCCSGRNDPAVPFSQSADTPAGQQDDPLPAEIEKRCMEIAKSCQDIIRNAPAFNSAVIDAIEEALTARGYPVIVRDGRYPEYLANSQGLCDFWEALTSHGTGQIGIIRVRETGGLSFLFFRSIPEQRECFNVLLDWDGDREPYLSAWERLPVYDLELTESGSFYYQIYPSDGHYADYGRILTRPVDRQLYDLTLAYLEPIGYCQNDLFCTDWTEQALGALHFNDLFGYLYEMRYGRQLELSQFSHFELPRNSLYQETPTCYRIPAELFEDAVMSFFAIRPEDLRSCAQCLDAAYPYADYRLHYPSRIPDAYPMVTGRRDSPDGTFTLSVAACCPDRKTDRLFCHDVTIRPLENGGFQYVSNRITYRSDYGIPPYFPRLPEAVWETTGLG